MEAAWGANNLGNLSLKLGIYEAATDHLQLALDIFREGENLDSENMSVKTEIANTLGLLSDATRYFGHVDKALDIRDAEIEFLKNHPDIDVNFDIQFKYIQALFLRARLASLKPNSENMSADFELVINGLEALTGHDPENIQWQLMFLRACVDYYFYTDAKGEKDKLIEKIRTLQTSILKIGAYSTRLELFYADVVKYEQNYQNPSVFSKWQDNYPEGTKEHFLIHAKLMTLDNAEASLARKVVSYHPKSSVALTAVAMNFLIEAHLILGNCQTASDKAKALKRRGYKAPNMETCER